MIEWLIGGGGVLHPSSYLKICTTESIILFNGDSTLKYASLINPSFFGIIISDYGCIIIVKRKIYYNLSKDKIICKNILKVKKCII